MVVAPPASVAACDSARAGGAEPDGCAPRGPPAVVASRGIAGIFEEVGEGLQQSLGLSSGMPHAGPKPNTVLDTSKLPPNAVLLNVYEVGDSEVIQKVNRIFTANNQVMVGGVFHSGVEVFGLEWGYGATEENRTGVGACHPRLHPQHTYRATVAMGETQLGEKEVRALIAKISQEWRGPDYNLIHNNCCAFCNALLKELGLRRIPGWVDRAARAASNLDQAVTLARSITAEGVQAKAAETLEQLRGQALDGAKALETIDHQQVQADVQAKAAEIGEKAQELTQALGASLWQWGQDLHATVQAKQPELAEFGEKAADALQQGLAQLTQDVQRALDAQDAQEAAQASKGRRRVGEGGAGGAGEGGSDSRFIRQSEKRQLRAGLLEEEMDGDNDLMCYTAADTLPANKAAAARQRPAVPALPVVEAPVDWLSGPSPTEAGPPVAADPDPVDLLSGDWPAGGSAPAPGPAAQAAARPAAEPFDLLA